VKLITCISEMKYYMLLLIQSPTSVTYLYQYTYTYTITLENYL